MVFLKDFSEKVNFEKKQQQQMTKSMQNYPDLLAHLSRRLIGELLVYRGIRRPSSTISNDFFSEVAGPILLIFHI